MTGAGFEPAASRFLNLTNFIIAGRLITHDVKHMSLALYQAELPHQNECNNVS